jgi:hypothetical protein
LIAELGIDCRDAGARSIYDQSNINTHHYVISFGPIIELIIVEATGGVSKREKQDREGGPENNRSNASSVTLDDKVTTSGSDGQRKQRGSEAA